MSKSSESPQGTVKVTDEPDVIRKKIRSAVTDSGREIVASPEKPAISNLLTIFSAASGRSVGEVEAAYEGKGYAEFKAELAEALVEFLRPLRDRYLELSANPDEIARLLGVGADKARAVARKTMETVNERIGLLRPGG